MALDGLKELQSDGFPVIVQPEDSSHNISLSGLISAIQRNKSRLDDHLAGCGALLFRGFPVSTAHDFAEVVEAFGYTSMGYKAGALCRTYITGPVFTANERPLHFPIGFHNEMAYLPDYPDVIMFFCEVAPPAGGETGIIQGRSVYHHMNKHHPGFIQDLEKKGLVYYNILTKTEWISSFGTSNKAEAEAKAAKVAKKLDWLDNGGVKVYYGPQKAVTHLAGTQEKAWFNCIGTTNRKIPSPRLLEFGDGSPLPPEAVKAAIDMMEENQVPHKWQKGDVMVLNNHAVLHARHPSEPPRRILISMLQT